MIRSVDTIAAMYLEQGEAQYGSEAVSQLQHALQCAHLAERSGASKELVVAALLHDMGHLLRTVNISPDRTDNRHQLVAIPVLRNLFPDSVLAPIALHVDAKRYLCQVDNSYWHGLSVASKDSLALQGGPFLKHEADAFISLPFATDAVALRRWDDASKNPLADPPGWSHFVKFLQACLQNPLLA